jgi:hypothetical protein
MARFLGDHKSETRPGYRSVTSETTVNRNVLYGAETPCLCQFLTQPIALITPMVDL